MEPGVHDVREDTPLANEAAMRDQSPIRVVLVGPSMDILGGQAVQVTRLLRRLRELNGIEVGFLPVNPRLPGPLRLLQQIKYVRTVATSIAYGLAPELPPPGAGLNTVMPAVPPTVINDELTDAVNCVVLT